MPIESKQTFGQAFAAARKAWLAGGSNKFYWEDPTGKNSGWKGIKLAGESTTPKTQSVNSEATGESTTKSQPTTSNALNDYINYTEGLDPLRFGGNMRGTKAANYMQEAASFNSLFYDNVVGGGRPKSDDKTLNSTPLVKSSNPPAIATHETKRLTSSGLTHNLTMPYHIWQRAALDPSIKKEEKKINNG